MIRRLALTSLSALSLACATASSEARLALTPVPEAPPDLDFQATGEVLTRDSSAAFNDWRVVGPHVNLTRREDGTWAGDIAHVNVVLTPSDGRLSGANADLHFLRWGNEVVVRGHVGGRGINVRVQPGDGMPIPDGIACRYEGNLVDCDKQSSSVRTGIELRGLAARTRDPVMPQFGLALLAVRGMSVIMR
jgi:hypothetical protein